MVVGGLGRVLRIAFGGLLGILVWTTHARAQVDPSTLTFGQAIELQAVQLSGDADGNPIYTPGAVRQATIEEIRRIALSDEDGDGIKGIRDACPLRSDCGRADGSFAELRGPAPKSDVMSPILIRFADAEALGDLILAQNAAQATPYFAVEDLIGIAVDAGFPTTTTAKWTSQYICGEGGKEACQRACKLRCPVPDPSGGKTEGRGHCLGDCLSECAKIRKCAPAGKGGKP